MTKLIQDTMTSTKGEVIKLGIRNTLDYDELFVQKASESGLNTSTKYGISMSKFSKPLSLLSTL